MSYLDTRISELTTESEAHLLRSSQPHGWLGAVRAMRRGRMGWIFWVTWIAQIVLLVLAIIWAANFFAATDVLTALKFGLSAATALILTGIVKISLAPHMHAERILRELKRIEILILAGHAEK